MAARKDSRIKKHHREAIQTSMLIKRLDDYALGNVKMEPGQVTAALGLLRKSLPDLSAIEQTNINADNPSSMSDADLEAIIEASQGSVEKLKAKSKG